MHSLFKVINKNCPKNQHRKMQLRSDDGRLLTPIEEHAKLVSFVRETWAGTPLSLPHQDDPPGVPFDVHALTAALRLIPATKAVAPDCAPGMIWSGLAEDLAQPLYDLLHDWWNQSPPIIPSHWRTGWLVLIPKPAKPPCRPQNLRPLALQCPLGKAVIGLLTKLALQQAMPELTRWPVWAYVPFRSVQDSLNKVALHCRLVQQLCASQRSTPHNRANAAPRYIICGGFQIFLDIDRAFDSVDRCKLFTKLHELGIDVNIIQLLWGWHADTDYIVSHAGASTPVRVQKGLRQGCKAAPFLWNCLVTIFLRQLSSAVSTEWVHNCLSIYADDFHIGCIFRNLEELKFALHSIGHVLQMLNEFDLSVNPSKSVAIDSTTGTNWRKHRAKIVHQDHAGEKLQIPLPDGSNVFIPVQTQTKYLGCILGYGNFADATTHHRIALAKVGFARLRRWLCSKSSHRQFQISRRFQLWQTCILPILTYGIFPIGITPLGAQKLLTVMQTMIRQLTGDHPSRTGHTHEFVHRQLFLPRPVELLLGALSNLSESVSQRRLHSSSHDFACTLTWDHLLPMREILIDAQAALDRRRAHSALSQEILATEQLFHCACCSFHTNDTAAFRRHCTVAHGLRMYRTLALNPADFAFQGLPTCKFCHRSFQTWHSFQIHVQRGCQAVLLGPQPCTRDSELTALAAAGVRPIMTDLATRGHTLLTASDLRLLLNEEWGDRVLAMIHNQTLHLLEHEQAACHFLSKRCALCGIHFSRTQEVHQHYQTMHPTVWPDVPHKAIMLTNVYSSDTPCAHCGSGFRTHRCPVWTQIAALVLAGAGLARPEVLDREAITLRCDICLEWFVDSATLAQHLQTVHKLAGQSFNIARDSLQSQAICAHCGSAHTSLEGLRSHITQGRCRLFNPAAISETTEICQEWLDMCLHGHLVALLQPPMTRMRLTLHCKQCGKVYSRAADLAHHLVNAHSRLWRQSQDLTLMLVSLLYGSLGCQCNPSIHQQRANHICLPLRQVAMIYYRLSQCPMMPFGITESALSHMLSDRLPAPPRFMLEQLFAHRHFHELWTKPEVLTLMRTTCVLCGAETAAAGMCRHLREAHPCNHSHVVFYQNDLLTEFLKQFQTDFQCPMCQQVFNLPPDWSDVTDTVAIRQEQVLGHLSGNCPNLLQSALLLALALNGGRLEHDWHGGERTGSTHGLLQVSGPSVRAATTVSESETPESAPPRRSKIARTNSRRSDNTGESAGPSMHEGDGTASAPTRAQLELDAKHRLFRVVLSTGTNRSSSGDAGGDQEMATSTEERQSYTIHDSETAPDATTPGGPPHQADQGGRSPQNGPAGSDLPHQEDSAGGPLLAVHEMGSHPEDAGAGQEEASPNEQDDATHSGAHRGFSGSHLSGPVSWHGSDESGQNHPMAAAAQHAPQSPIRFAMGAHPQCGMDASGNGTEATCGAPERPCQELAGNDPTPEGPRQGQDQTDMTAVGDVTPRELLLLMRRELCHLQFGNAGHWCFANVTFYCLLWSLLGQHTVPFAFWGTHFDKLRALLQTSAANAVQLETTPWFQQLYECWGRTCNQQDNAEFIQSVLAWLTSPAIDLRWERRLESGDQTNCVDCGAVYMPVFMQFTPTLALQNECTLESIVTAWHQADGLQAALLAAAPVVCIHLDRLHCLPGQSAEKISCAISLDSEVLLPVFTGDGLTSAPVNYVIIAAASHLGQDQAGHYQALLKILPTVISEVQPVAWLLTQDNMIPQPTWRVPEMFSRNTTVFWLIRADCLELPNYRLALQATSATTADALMPATKPNTENAILAVLKNAAVADAPPAS